MSKVTIKDTRMPIVTTLNEPILVEYECKFGYAWVKTLQHYLCDIPQIGDDLSLATKCDVYVEGNYSVEFRVMLRKWIFDPTRLVGVILSLAPIEERTYKV